MAQKAFKKLERRMELATEMRLARLITQECNQLHERAAEVGVTALLGRPVHRAPPNQRFLKNTLRSVEFVNQKRDEDDMWRQWTQRREQTKNGTPVAAQHSDLDSGERICGPNVGNRGSNVALECCSDPGTSNLFASQSSTSNQQSTPGSSESFEIFLSKRRVRGNGRIGPQPEACARSTISVAPPVKKQARDPAVRKHRRDKKHKRIRKRSKTSE